MSSSATVTSKEPSLKNIRVIDLSQNLPGPYCTRLLADQGAEVIKVEASNRTDPARHLPRYHKMVNGGKKCITLDLKKTKDKEKLLKLASKADIFIESFRPGVMKRLGLDYETLSKLNQSIVYCSISGYGQDSVMSHIPAHDINLQAMSGYIGFTGRRERQSTEESSIPLADMVTSLYAHSAILAALLAKQSTGKGAYIDMPMADGLAHMVYTWQQTTPDKSLLDKQLKKTKIPTFIQHSSSLRAPIESFITRGVLPALPHYGVFECAGKTKLCLGIVDEQHFWQTLCAQLGGRLLSKMATLNMLQRALFSPAIKYHLSKKLKKHSAEYWYDILAEQEGLPVSLVASSECFHEQDYFQTQLSKNGELLSPLQHPDYINFEVYPAGHHNDEYLK